MTPISAATWSDGRAGVRELYPLLQAGVELVGRHVLGRNRLGVGPVAGESISEREVLADARVGTLGPGDRLQRGDGVERPAGQGQRQSVIGLVERAAAGIEDGDRLAILALSDFGQDNLQHQLRLVRIERQRILECGLGRIKAPRREIGSAEQRANAGIVRRPRGRFLGKIDGGRRIVGGQRGKRPGGKPDLSARQARGTARMALRRRAPADHAGQRDDGDCGGEADRFGHWNYPLFLAFSAIPSSSGMSTSN